MPQIQVLPKQLADMIAAGEVVERPASVVKELVENSIDAGADALTVEIRHGGTTYIRVTDNGRGIPQEEVPTAFLRHATSKLRSADELDAIATLGFRGEALAAISAVSHVEILTKPQEQETGYRFVIENSQPVEQGPAGCPDGTTVVVRDVFFSVPARYKFLKTDAAEGSAIHAVLEREALAHPEVSFRFVRDGKRVFSTAGDGELLNVMEAVLPGESRLLLPVASADGPFEVTGYVGRPTRCRGSRGGQFTFVNGRWIKSKLLTAALERAYENQRMVGKFPIAALHITMPLDKVDVNAHPTKTEVRFVEEKELFGRVYHAVESALRGAADRPDLRTQPVSPAPAASAPAPADPAASPRSPAGSVSPAPAAFSPAASNFVPAASARGEETATFRSPLAPAQSFKPRAAVWPSEEAGFSVAAEKFPPAQEEIEQLKMPAPPAPFAPTARYDPAPSPAEEPWEETPWRVVGEAMRTYIIVEQGDKLLFIDKHAAHERMGFDALKAQDYRPMTQELLKPLVWRPAPEDRAELLAHAAELEEFGFQVEDFGGGSVAVRTAPDFLAYGDISSTLEELARQYALTGTADPAAQRDGLLHTMACKAAVKGGQVNAEQELLAIAKAVMGGEIAHCPHGRPVAAELTRKQLEKQFGRT